MSSNNDSNDDQHQVSRRDFIAAASAAGLTLSPGFLSFGEENRVGPLDTHNVQDNGEFVEQDPSPFNLSTNLDVNKRAEGIDVSVFDAWTQRDDGTLEGPAVDTDDAHIEQHPGSNNPHAVWVPEWPSIHDALATRPAVAYLGNEEYGIDETLEVQPQTTLVSSSGVAGKGGARIYANSSLNKMVTYIEDPDGMGDSVGGGAIGVRFDGNDNASRALFGQPSTRMRMFYACSMRWALDYGVEWRGRFATFDTCDIADNWGTNAFGALATGAAREVTFSNCRFADNIHHVELTGGAHGKISFTNGTVFTFGHENPWIDILPTAESDSVYSEEASVVFDDVSFHFWDGDKSASNAIVFPDTWHIPTWFTNVHFDGTDRHTGSATGNKAIRVPSGADIPKTFIKNVECDNFTASPAIDIPPSVGIQTGDIIGDDLYQNEGTEAGAIAIDATGTQTVTVSHGLAKTPLAEDIEATLTSPSQTDWSGHIAWIGNISGTSFDVTVDITSASGTAGATADLSWNVEI